MNKSRILGVSTMFLAASLIAGCGGSKSGTDEPLEGCGIHGAADAVTGACKCETGYAGELCGGCADGWIPGEGSTADQTVCVYNCGVHGVNNPAWDVRSVTVPACLCHEGYAGEACTACADGWQDNDGDGMCAKSCELAAPELQCVFPKACDDASGEAKCEKPQAAWTVLVYLDGDNNVGYDAESGWDIAADELAEIAEGMKLAGDNASKLNVIVLFDDNKTAPDPLTHVYNVTRDGLQEIDTGMQIFLNGEADMSSEKTLMRFGVWSMKHFPAEKYALILWDHGGGWKDSGSGKPKKMRTQCGHKFQLTEKANHNIGFREIATDETNGISIDLTAKSITFADGAFAGALEAMTAQAGKKLDLVGYNACLMGMYEVAKETARGADYMVASSDTMLGLTGFNFDIMLNELAENSGMSGAELGRLIVNAHGDTEASLTEDEDETYRVNKLLALYDLSKLPALDTSLNTFGNELAAAALDENARSVLAEIAEDVQRFSTNEHADVTHLASLVKARAGELPGSAALAAAADALTAAASDVIDLVRVNSLPEYWGISHDDAGGMAIFFPRGVNCQYYKTYPGYAELYDDPLYGDLYTLSMEPCVYYPDEPPSIPGWGTSDANYSLREVKSYIQRSWNDGWSAFLRNYHQVNMCDSGYYFDARTESCVTNGFIQIPAGSFVREASPISMDAFELQKTPVTVAEYKKCFDAKACAASAPMFVAFEEMEGDWTKLCNFGRGDKWMNHPMNCVSWDGAKEYCEWIGARLPSEEEWEYAATHNGREHLNTQYSFGDTAEHCVHANYMDSESSTYCDGLSESNTVVGTSAVGTYSPAGDSPLGLVDMSGNVWEWTTAQAWDEDMETNRLRVSKGGAFNTQTSKMTIRGSVAGDPDYGSETTGFRCVK